MGSGSSSIFPHDAASVWFPNEIVFIHAFPTALGIFKRFYSLVSSWRITRDHPPPRPPRPGRPSFPAWHFLKQLPPSYEAEAHLDAFFDDTRSMKLTVPMQKQRRHIPGHAGEIDETISPIGDRERRELHALEMHEFTAPKKPTPPPPATFGGARYRRPSQATF